MCAVDTVSTRKMAIDTTHIVHTHRLVHMELLAACELVFASFEHVSVCLTVESVNKFEYRILCRHNSSKQEYCIECLTEKWHQKRTEETDVNIN